MEICKRTLGVYLPFAKSEIQKALAYKISFFGYILGDIFQIVIAFYLWSAIFSSSPNSTINGFTKNEMLVYIVMSFITAMTIGNGTEWAVASEVQSGEIAINLIRPINYKLRLISQSIGSIMWQFIAIFLPIWVTMLGIRYFTLGALPPHITTIGTYFLSLIFSFIIWFLFNFCFGLMAFYVTYIWGLNMFKETIVRFLSGAIIPIIFFPLWFQKFLILMPFGSINYTPVMIYLNKYTGYETIKALVIQALWIILLYLFSRFLWDKAIKKLTIMGG